MEVLGESVSGNETSLECLGIARDSCEGGGEEASKEGSPGSVAGTLVARKKGRLLLIPVVPDNKYLFCLEQKTIF